MYTIEVDRPGVGLMLVHADTRQGMNDRIDAESRKGSFVHRVFFPGDERP